MAWTQDPWITSQTPYHWATWDPSVNKTSLVQIESICGHFQCFSNSVIFFDRVENKVVQGENAGNQHFLLFPYNAL